MQGCSAILKSISIHSDLQKPSAWVLRFAPLVSQNGSVLDLAAGRGRHGRLFLKRGNQVTLVDRSLEGLRDLENEDRAEVIQADLEDGSPWPMMGRIFAGVVVINYLYRPLIKDLLKSIEPEGVLIYETFSRGNEAYGRPSNPEFLLDPGELLEFVAGTMQVLAYENGIERKGELEKVVQRICAVRHSSARYGGKPAPSPINPLSQCG